MKRTITAVVALLAIFALGVPAIGTAGKGGGGKPKTAKVKVYDDYFSKNKLKIKTNTKVNFKWDKSNGNTHNVTFKSGPKGVKRSKPCAKGKIEKCNTSASGAIGINFGPTFDKKGTYKFLCTVHPTTMEIKVVVEKKKKKK
jgi:plastocyanin